MKRQITKLFKTNSTLLYSFGIGICLLLICILLFQLQKYVPFTDFLPKPALSKSEQITQDMLDKCKQYGDVCYSIEFAKLTKVEPLDFTLTVFNQIQMIDPNARGCHLIAHSISTEETLKNLDMWEDTLARLPTDKCTGGFMHGVFEARQAQDPTLSINENTIPELCRVVEEKAKRSNDQDCSHIMGHLLLVEHEADIAQANLTCNKLSESLQYECFSGVYMENETRDGIVDHGLGKHIPWNETTTQTQQSLCEKAYGIAAQACWREISHMFVFISKDYPPDVYKLCEQSNNANLTKNCYFHAVGIIVASSFYNPQNAKLLCQPYIGNADEFSGCISVGIGSLLMSTPQFIDRAIEICESIDFRFREGCYEYLSQRLAELVPAKDLAIYCKNVPYPFQKRCEYPYL